MLPASPDLVFRFKTWKGMPSLAHFARGKKLSRKRSTAAFSQDSGGGHREEGRGDRESEMSDAAISTVRRSALDWCPPTPQCFAFQASFLPSFHSLRDFCVPHDLSSPKSPPRPVYVTQVKARNTATMRYFKSDTCMIPTKKIFFPVKRCKYSVKIQRAGGLITSRTLLVQNGAWVRLR